MRSTAILIQIVMASISYVTVQEIDTVSAFTPSSSCRPQQRVTTHFTVLSVATDPITESSETSSSSESVELEAADVTIPTNLPSDCGMDYVPLASMLATGQLAEADQVRYHVHVTSMIEIIHIHYFNPFISFLIYMFSLLVMR